MKTIEEISGKEGSNLVFETAGFRQGLAVGEYFVNVKKTSFTEITKIITNTYASAGWGRASVHNFDEEKKTLTVHLKNSWEHKINVKQKKKVGGIFYLLIMQVFLQGYLRQICGIKLFNIN